MDALARLRRNLFIPLIHLREGSSPMGFVPEVTRILKGTRAEIENYQTTRIKYILKHAYANVPFYRRHYDEQAYDVCSFKSLSDMEHVPSFGKEEIRRFNHDFLSSDAAAGDLIKSGTGGTTSAPIDLYYTKECESRKNACTLFFKDRYGVKLGEPNALLWGAPQDLPSGFSLKWRIKNFLSDNVLFLFSSYLNENVMQEYFNKLKKFRPCSLQAYPTPLYIFVSFLETRGLRLDIPVVHVTAEKLYPYQRTKIENYFGHKIYNWYGARELGHIGGECDEHEGFHINSYGVYLEVIKKSRPVFGTEGEIVATDLLNEWMPLIRYRIGDMGILSKEQCPCGLSLPLLTDVIGRHGDVFQKRDGTLIPGISFADRIVTECHGIEQMQLIQKDFEFFVINIVKGRHFRETDIEDVKRRLMDYMREPVRLEVNFVEDIPKEKSGKIRFCKNDMHP